MHPFVIQTFRNIDSVFDSWRAVAEWRFHFPGKSVGNICHRAVNSNLYKVSGVESHSLGHIVSIANRNFLLGYGHHSGCSRLVFCRFRFNFDTDVVYGVDGDGIVVVVIPLDAIVVHIGVFVIIVFTVRINAGIPVSKVDEINHISTQDLSLVIIVKVHFDATLHNYIGRKVVGIDKLLDILANIPAALVDVINVYGGVQTGSSFHLTATVVVGSERTVFRSLPILHHVEGEGHVFGSFGSLIVHPVSVEEVLGCFGIFLRSTDCWRGHIGILVRVLDDTRSYRDVDHLPPKGLEGFGDLAIFVRPGSGDEFEVDFGIQTLEFQLILIVHILTGTCHFDSFLASTHREICVTTDSVLVELHSEVLQILLVVHRRCQKVRGDFDHICIQVGNEIDCHILSGRDFDFEAALAWSAFS